MSSRRSSVTMPAFLAPWCWPWMPSTKRQLQQHPFQGEMSIALQGQCLDLFPVAVRADIERDPAVVAHVRRNLIPGICNQQALLIHPHPKTQRESLTVMTCQGEGFLACLPNGVTKLTLLVRLRQLQTHLAQGFEHRRGPRRFQRVDLAGG